MFLIVTNAVVPKYYNRKPPIGQPLFSLFCNWVSGDGYGLNCRDTPPGVSVPHHQKKDRVRFSTSLRGGQRPTWQSPGTSYDFRDSSRRFPEGELARRAKRGHPGVRGYAPRNDMLISVSPSFQARRSSKEKRQFCRIGRAIRESPLRVRTAPSKNSRRRNVGNLLYLWYSNCIS